MKKKALSLLLVLCMVLALLPMGALAWSPEDENYVDSGTYHDSSVTWVILEEDGETVLYIEGTGAMDGKEATDQYDYDREYRPRWDNAKDPWDSYSSSITKVVIGDGITSLGMNCFTGMRNLREVVIGDGITTIAEMQYGDYGSAKKGEYGNTLGSAFYQLYSLEKVTVGAKVEKFTADMFKYCSSLKTIEISEDNENMQSKDGFILNKAGTEILYVAPSVCEPESWGEPCVVTIPEGVTSLTKKDLLPSSSVTKLVLPASLKEFDAAALSSTSALSEIEVAEGSEKFFVKDNILYSKSPVAILLVPSKVQAEVELADGLTSLDDETFNNNSTITKLTIPASLTSIGSDALSGMSKLEEVVVKEGNTLLKVENGLVTKTENGETEALFVNANYAGVITIPEGVKTLKTNIFGNNNSKRPLVTGLELPASLETIVNGGSVWSPQTPFTLLTGLETVTVAEGNKNYAAESNVLYNADKTEIVGVPMQLAGDIVIPEGVTSVGSQFSNHPKITSITFPASATSISSGGFSGCDALAKFDVAVDNPNYAAQDGILYDKEMTRFAAVPTAISGDIVIPDTVTSTANGYYSAFRNWSNVTSITLPEELTQLESNAFQNCSSLTYMVLPETLTEIPYGAFEGCSNLEKVYIPAGVTTIGSGYSARWYADFEGCDKLTDIYFGGTEEQWNAISFGNDADKAFVDGDSVTVHFNHKHRVETESVPATCEEPGSVTGACECGYGKVNDVIDPIGHDWDEGTVTTKPTCTEPGVMTYTCQHDETHTKTEEIPAKGHDLVKTEAVPATCEEDGAIEYYTCSECGKIFSDAEGTTEITEADLAVKATGHDWDEGKVTKEPTYTEEGEMTYTCKHDPSHTKTEPIAKLEKCDGGDNCPSKDFIDVDRSEESWSHEAIDWAVLNKATNGIDPTHFGPTNACTRAQAVTFLWRAMGEPEPTTTANPFKDVSADAYYYKAVLWAAEKEITNGVTADTFAPDATCTRGQIVTFLWRAEGKVAPTAAASFTDVPADAYFADAVAWAVENGITNGTSPTTFAPNDNCTRAHIVTFLYRDLK